MKNIFKRLASLVLCVCILVGMPISVQANEGATNVPEYMLDAGQNLTAAKLYDSAHVRMSFSENVTVPAGCEIALGLYKDGVLDTAKGGPWSVNITPGADNAQKELLGRIDGMTGKAIKELAGTEYKIGLTITQPLAGYVTVDAVDEKLLTLDNVEVYNDFEFVLTFSEPVNLPSNSYIGLNLLTGTNGYIMRYTYESGEYKVVSSLNLSANPTWDLCQWTLNNPEYYNEEHTQIKVNLDGKMKQKGVLATYSELVAVSQKMPAGGCFVLRIADTNATTQPGGNNLVESVTTIDGTPLLATRKNDQIDQKQFVMPTDIRLNGAVIHSDKIVEMQFSSRLKLNTFAKNVSIAIGQYDANGVLDNAKTSWPVKVMSTGTSNDNLAYNVFGSVEEMPQAEEGYTLGLMITAKSGSYDGVIDGVLGHYNQSVAATHAVNGQDAAVASVKFSNEATLNVEKVEIFNDNKFILTLTEDIDVPVSGTYFAGLTLYNTGHYMMRYKWNGTAYEAQTGGTINNSTLFGAQWGLAISRYGTNGNQLEAKITGTMANGAPATYSEILKVVDAAAGGKLVLRIADAVNHRDAPGYNGYVDAIGNDKKSLLAADWSYAEDQNEFEYTLIQTGLYVESAVVEDEDTIKVTFSHPIKNVDMGAGSGDALLRLVSLSNGEYHWSNVYGEHPQWGGRANFAPADADSEYNDVWYYTYTDLKALYLSANDPNSQYSNYVLSLGLQELISPANNDGYVQNFEDEKGNWLITTNRYKDGTYIAITDPNGIFDEAEPIQAESIVMTSEDVITVTFDQPVSDTAIQTMKLRFLDANGALVYYQNGNFNTNRTGKILEFPVKATKTDDEGKAWTLVMDLPNRKSGLDLRTMQALRELADEKGYQFKLAYSTGAGFLMYYRDITYTYNTDTTLGDFKVEKVKQINSHELIITFSHDLADLLDMNGKAKPFISLRLVDPATGRLVRYNVGSDIPSTTTPSGSKVAQYMQWGAKSVTINGENRDQVLVTFPDSLDIGNLIRQTNMAEDLKAYDVALSFEEADPGNGTYTAGNELVHHIRRAADGKQLKTVSQYVTSADSFLWFIKDEDLLDPMAEVYVDSIKVIDQTRIVVTFSESVCLNGGKGIVGLVNTQLKTMLDANGVPYEWGGHLAYYDDARTQIVFVLDYNGRNNRHPMQGLDDIVNANLESGDYKLMLGIRDDSGMDGRVNAISTPTGKVLLADVMNNSVDTVWCLIDKNQIPQGELTLTKVEVISDIAAIATFSAPIEITGNPYMCIRWFNAEGRMVWKTADGEYVYTSKTNGKNNTPMQWSLKWEWYDKAHTQIKLVIGNGQEGLANFLELMNHDFNAEIEGSYLGIGVEELNPEAAMGNWQVDNITLLSDPRIALTATLVKGNTNYDGTYVKDLVCNNKLREVKVTSIKLLNDMQMRITFSEPVELVGRVYSGIRFVNEETGGLLYWGDEYNRNAVQFSGTLAFENDSHTSMIWTMAGNSIFGVNNIYDIVNYQNGLTRLAGTPMQFCIEELTVADVITVGGRNALVDNFVTKDGLSRVKATKLGAYDGIWLDFNASMLKNKEMLELLTVKAIDDQTLEITFSEGVLIDDTDEHLSMSIRYLSSSGNSEVLANGKTANFKGTWEYKDENKNVILWKLNSNNAKSLTQIFNYEGSLKWNRGARVCFVLMNDNEELPTKTMRVKGITDLSGYRHLACKLMDISTIQMDIEITYDKPDPIVESDTEVEELIEYYSDYVPFIIGGGAVLVVGIVAAVLIGRRKKEGK